MLLLFLLALDKEEEASDLKKKVEDALVWKISASSAAHSKLLTNTVCINLQLKLQEANTYVMTKGCVHYLCHMFLLQHALDIHYVTPLESFDYDTLVHADQDILTTS